MYGFGEQIAWKEGVEIDRLWDQCKFIGQMLVNENVVENYIVHYPNFTKVIGKMISYGVIESISTNKLRVL